MSTLLPCLNEYQFDNVYPYHHCFSGPNVPPLPDGGKYKYCCFRKYFYVVIHTIIHRGLNKNGQLFLYFGLILSSASEASLGDLPLISLQSTTINKPQKAFKATLMGGSFSAGSLYIGDIFSLSRCPLCVSRHALSGWVLYIWRIWLWYVLFILFNSLPPGRSVCDSKTHFLSLFYCLVS